MNFLKTFSYAFPIKIAFLSLARSRIKAFFEAQEVAKADKLRRAFTVEYAALNRIDCCSERQEWLEKKLEMREMMMEDVL